MDFRAPLVLLGLALVPLALAAYVVAQRRGRRYAVRYTNLEVLASVASSRWTRHIPAALALLSLAALLVALARPQRTVAAERREATVIMVTDTSGSMKATDVRPDRLTAAKAAARGLATKLPRDFRLGLVTFSSTAEQQVEPTTDRARVLAALARLQVKGATAMGDGLALGLDAARVPVPDGAGGTRRPPAALVLLSDGANTRGSDPIDVAQRARKAGIRVYAVALGTQRGVLETTDPDTGALEREPVPPDTLTLREIARETRGRFFDAPDAAKLESVYAGLGTGFATTREKQEVTAAFAGGALVLLLAGVGMSLLRSGRLP